VADRLEKVVELNPHLGKYIDGVKASTKRMPEFKENLSRDLSSLKDLNIIYPVGDPIFVHVFSKGELGKFYNVVQPELDERERALRDRLLDRIFERIGLEEECPTKEKLESTMDKIMREAVHIGEGRASPFSRSRLSMTKLQYRNVSYHLKRDIIEMGPLEPLIRDPYIEDINCLGTRPLHIVHKIFKTLPTNIDFGDLRGLQKYVRGIGARINKPVSISRPIVDSALPDGSRVNIIYSNDVSVNGPSFTIRKFSPEPLSFVQLIKWGTFSSEIAAYLWLCLENEMSIFVCGETASGKTTALNSFLPLIHFNSKIYSVEDTSEVLPPQRIWQQLLTRDTGPAETRVDTFTLLKASLRSRPNYVIVGEIRGKEGNIAFQAMQAGRAVIATFHASSIAKMVQRFTSNPINVPVRFMGNLNVVMIQQAVYTKGKVLRRTTSLGEIMGYSKEIDGVMSKDVFIWNPVTDEHRFRGMYNSFVLEEKIAKARGYPDKRRIYEDFERRTRIINALVERNITGYNEVNQVVKSFQIHGEAGLPFAV
jgi:flagellar protein FlaI